MEVIVEEVEVLTLSKKEYADAFDSGSLELLGNDMCFYEGNKYMIHCEPEDTEVILDPNL